MQLSVCRTGQVLSVCTCLCTRLFHEGVFIISMEEKYISLGPLAMYATYAKALYCFGSKQRQQQVR